MKYTPLIIAVSLGIAALSPIANAAERERNREEREAGPDGGMGRLREHFNRVRDDVERAHAEKLRVELADIRRDMERLSVEIDSRRFDKERVREQAGRLNESLNRISDRLAGHGRPGPGPGGITIQVR